MTPLKFRRSVGVSKAEGLNALLPAALAAATEISEEQQADNIVAVDPDCVVMNSLHRRAMAYADIVDLSNSIAATGQTLPALGWRNPEDPTQVILVYGARRLSACALAGVKLNVRLIPPPSEEQLISLMHTENRSRSNYTPLEFGRELLAYLETKRYPNVNALAEALGEDRTKCVRCIQIASLPAEILDLYKDPGHLPLVIGVEFSQAIASDPAARLRLLAACEQVKSLPDVTNPTPFLVAALKPPKPAKAVPGEITHGGKKVGSYVGGDGANDALRIVVDRKAPAELKQKLLALIRSE